MSLSYEQKNINILSRFETKTVGTKVRRFTFRLDGSMVTMIDVNNASLASATESLFARFGRGRVSEIIAY